MMLEDVTPAETLEQAVEMIDYDAFRAEQRRASTRRAGCSASASASTSSRRPWAPGTSAWRRRTVRVEPSGKVIVLLGTSSHGQSVETTMAQVVAEHLGVDVDDVVVVQGDTASDAVRRRHRRQPHARSIAGGATREASLEVRDKVVAIAAHLLEARADDLEIDDGRVVGAGHAVASR